MHSLGLSPKRDQHASQLTYAEMRALELGVTLGSGSEVILLDEPTAGMNHSETEKFLDLILDVTRGKTLLAVEHDMGVVFGLANKIAVLVYGEIIAYDTPEAIKSNPAVQEAYLGVLP
jgi:branched-chain amino acid transport system ATP-binding protein